MTDNIEKELLEMQEVIQQDEKFEEQKKGEITGLMKQLKGLGFETEEAAEEKLEASNKKIAHMEAKLQSGVEDLNEKYDW